MKFVAFVVVTISICSACSIYHFDMAPVPYTITETISCGARSPSNTTMLHDGAKVVQPTIRCKPRTSIIEENSNGKERQVPDRRTAETH